MAAEKTLTYLAMPVGIVWAVLAGRLMHAVLVGALHRQKAPLIGWLALWILASPWLADWVVASIENSVTPYRAEIDPPLDVIVVLGGGTSLGRERAQVGEAGDRVVLAAELFKAGRTKKLITTGQSVANSGLSNTSASGQTIEIWTKLGIPADAIISVPGRNTIEEISHVKQIVGQWADQRIGLLTSALHLPRAIRLAKAAGLPVVPIAADVRSANNPFLLWEIVPQATNLQRLHFCQIELMARLVAR